MVRQSVNGFRHSGSVSHRGIDERVKERKREKTIPESRGVPGGLAKARRAEEKRTVPLVRAGRWRLGHAWQSCVFFFFFFMKIVSVFY